MCFYIIFTYYYGNNVPIITVIIGSLVPIITRSIIGPLLPLNDRSNLQMILCVLSNTIRIQYYQHFKCQASHSLSELTALRVRNPLDRKLRTQSNLIRKVGKYEIPSKSFSRFASSAVLPVIRLVCEPCCCQYVIICQCVCIHYSEE